MIERTKVRISFFAYILLLLTFDTSYPFMIFNLFLAFAALELSFLLPLFKIKDRKEIPASILFYLVFLLMSPNIFYVVTDLIHLKIFTFDFKQGLVLEEWWNFSILTAGVILAIYYFTLMMKQLHLLLVAVKWRTFIIFGFMILGSIGIYIGRFLRFHSVHLFTEPLSLITQVLASINVPSLLFVTWMSVLQFLIYWLFVEKKGEQHV
ncbi:DUF1361 domain-containing protein [Priestia taiwanensis]|uniref:DUF1361 domain-containing protein n=1 Tax=Priestia taiwanensis TaxID=1347902 RepID=A0A917EKE8_9BACI|nr:DUF1361 domain-containing protein [Priestia taiwanensis]MBM7361793.1 putative membrane protein [Priestia taiwanensis]GGE57048.1 hypothetical protein GCM10007140_04200 [Priestia taiwanensis]